MERGRGIMAQQAMLIHRKKPLGTRMWKARWFYLLMLPGIIYFLIYRYLPMAGLVMAFQDYNPSIGIMKSPWVGWKHFQQFFSYGSFETLFSNTLIISVLSLVFSFPAPIIMALLLNEVRHSGYKRVTQTLMYLPHFLSTVVVCSIAYQLFSTDSGIINRLLVSMGFSKINVLMNASAYRPLFVGMGIWQGTGWGTIIYLAALSNVDVQMYEASTLEGAGRWKQMWYITLPSILPIVMVNLVLSMGSLLDVGLEKTLLLSNAMNRSVSEVFDSYVYQRGVVNGKYSFTTAVGLFKSFVGMILVFTSNWLSKKVTDEAIY
jgi:putative aldouronate transport system permease protein